MMRTRWNSRIVTAMMVFVFTIPALTVVRAQDIDSRSTARIPAESALTTAENTPPAADTTKMTLKRSRKKIGLKARRSKTCTESSLIDSHLAAERAHAAVSSVQSASIQSPSAASVTIWIVSVLCALGGTAIILFLISRAKNTAHPVVQQPARRVVHEDIPAAGNRETTHAAGDRRIEPEELPAEGPSIFDGFLKQQRTQGEMDLISALQGLKLKHGTAPLADPSRRTRTKRSNAAEAKKLGVGVGELTLAERLGRLSEENSGRDENV